MIDEETGVASLNDKDSRGALNGDYSKIEIIDPITQRPIQNLNSFVESSSQLEAIHI